MCWFDNKSVHKQVLVWMIRCTHQAAATLMRQRSPPLLSCDGVVLGGLLLFHGLLSPGGILGVFLLRAVREASAGRGGASDSQSCVHVHALAVQIQKRWKGWVKRERGRETERGTIVSHKRNACSRSHARGQQQELARKKGTGQQTHACMRPK